MENPNPFAQLQTTSDCPKQEPPSYVWQPLVIAMVGTVVVTSISFALVEKATFGTQRNAGHMDLVLVLTLGGFFGAVGLFPVTLITFCFKDRDRIGVSCGGVLLWALISGGCYYYFRVSDSF